MARISLDTLRRKGLGGETYTRVYQPGDGP